MDFLRHCCGLVAGSTLGVALLRHAQIRGGEKGSFNWKYPQNPTLFRGDRRESYKLIFVRLMMLK